MEYQKKQATTLNTQIIEMERKIDRLVDLIVDANSLIIRLNYEKRLNNWSRIRTLSLNCFLSEPLSWKRNEGLRTVKTTLC